ncbi:hypothetical protein LJB99_01770 [Deltaproteobacteria bacterium OttesenSCG-928-K17]|nr:hypothetical protein [Deltaproteobacteria bacterium OttesenSCG-928-K17]
MSGGMRYVWSANDGESEAFEGDPGVMTRRLAPLESFFSLLREAFARLKDNLAGAAFLLSVHLVATIVVLTLVALVMKISGSPWPALIAGGLFFCLLIGPALGALTSFMAVNIWDDGAVSLLDAWSFCQQNVADCLFSYWWALLYEAGLWFRALPSLWPGALMAAILHTVLHFFTEVENLFYIDALIVVGMTIPLAILRLWERIRRISTFLYLFTAFEVVDGDTIFSEDLPAEQSGYWRSRFARLFHRLDDDWWRGPLNRALGWKIFFTAVWLVPAGLFFYSGISPMAAFFLTAIFPLQIRFILSLWYAVAAAGWFRNNLSSGLYY